MSDDREVESDVNLQLADSRRRFAYEVTRKLVDSGFEALWAGGCVRDLLLEHHPVDYDVATSARPEQVRAIFGHRRTLPVGAAFGVIIVQGPNRESGQVEVATFRNDAAYSDGRRPDSVVFSTAKEDAARRDFTINGMFWDPLSDHLIDYVGGRQDLELRVIRAIGNADERIGEDKLRMLRAVRFAARFGFAIEEETRRALRRHASELAIVSGERIAMEMRKTLACGGRVQGLLDWVDTGLLESMIPELHRRWDRIGDESVRLLRAVSGDSELGAIAAMVLPLFVNLRGSGSSGAIAEIGAENDGFADLPRFVAEFKSRLKLSNEESEGLAFVIRNREVFSQAHRLPWSRVQPLLLSRYLASALDVLGAQVACGFAAPSSLEFLRERLAWPQQKLNPDPLLDGRDLKASGFEAGPRFRELLTLARSLQLDGELPDRAAALQWLSKQGR